MENQIPADGCVNQNYAQFYSFAEAEFGEDGSLIVDAYAESDALQHAGCSVYFMGRKSDGAIKIGYAANVKSRRRMLERQYETPVEVLATVGGGLGLERLYQAKFAADRLHGEWFARTPVILAEIDRLNATRPTDTGRG